MTPIFSVIIAHLNDPIELHFTLYNYFKELEHIPYEIIVVDNGSDAGTLGTVRDYIDKFAKHHPIKLYEYTEYKGTVPPWQYGAMQATGKYLVFSDSHILNSSGFFDEQWDILQDETIKTLYASACFEQWGAPFTCGYIFNKSAFSVGNATTDKKEPYELLISQMGCVITDREHFIKRGMFGLSCFHEYGGFGAEEIFLAFKTWMFGGRCVLNPNVYYLHTFLQKDQSGRKMVGQNKCIGAYVLGGEEYMREVIAGSVRIFNEVVKIEAYGEKFLSSIPSLAQKDREFILNNASLQFNQLMEKAW